MKKYFLFSFILFISVSFSLKADGNQKAWELLHNNKRFEARNAFQLEAKTNNADAYLGLAITYYALGKNDSAFFAFENFYNNSSNPYPYLYSLWSETFLYQGRGYMEDYKVAFLNKIIADTKAHGTLKAMAHNQLGHYYEAVNKFDKRNDEYNLIGSIDNWQVLGTFDNTSGSGFAKDWGALEKRKHEDKFKNKVEANVSWYAPPSSRLDRWFMFDYYFSIGNSIMYAQTYVKSETDQEVYLRSGCSGSIKIWVNDAIVLSEATERNCDMDVYANKIKLNKGYNRFLLQIGESETNNANFLLRLTDDKGNALSGITSSSDDQEYTKAAASATNEYKLFAEEYFENLVKTDKSNALNFLLLSNTLMRNDKIFEARKVLKSAKALAPNSTFVSYKMIEAYSRDKNVTDLTKEQEKVKKNDPDAIMSIQLAISEASGREDLDGFEKNLNKLIEIYGEDENTDNYKINLLSAKKQNKELIDLVKVLYKKYPHRADLMEVCYSIEKNASKDNSKGLKLLKDFNKKFRAEKAEDLLINYYFENGNKDAAMEILKKRIENFPYGIGYYDMLSNVNFQIQNYEEALKYTNKALEFAPYLGGYYKDRGKIFEAMGKNDDAIKAYNKAIKYQPTDYDSRVMLRKLKGEKELYENFPNEDITELFKKSPDAKDYPEDNSIVLLNETKRIIYNENASEQKEELLVKVFNQSGIDTWKHYSISFNSYTQRVILEKAEVLKKDGSTIKAEEEDGTVVFTNLEMGDAIHVLYKTENYFSGKLAQHFWDRFQFQYTIPTLISRYSILVPENKTFNHKIINGKVEEKVTTIGNLKLYEWSLKKQPALIPESYMPTAVDVAPYLFLSTIPDWKFVSNWYSDLSSIKAKADFEVKETIEEIFKGKTNLTELEKAKIIYTYIENNIGYSNVSFMHGAIIPQKASRTIATKLGDCKDLATLFVSMCKEVGVKANLMLVDTKDNGKYHLAMPSTDFNHCIALLQADGKKYIIELTNQKLGFASLPDMDVNANYLFIPRDNDKPADTLQQINLPTIIPNKVVRNTKIVVKDKDMDITRNTLRFGDWASDIRSTYADLGKDEREKTIMKNITDDFTSAVKLKYISFGDLTKLQDTINMNYAFIVSKGITDVAGFKVIKMPWSDAIGSLEFLALNERKFEFMVNEFLGSNIYEENITIDLPAGSTLPEKPKSVSFTCNAIDYAVTYDVTVPSKIKAKRTMKINAERVAAKDYDTFKDFFTKVVESDTKQIAFK
jgi:tetratricopeptide (TPR) repeat protein